MKIFKTTGKYALLGGTAVALAIALSGPLRAASMSDAGIGKRVTDLEAEVRMLKARVKALEDRKVGVPGKLVQSGNSRVKVTLYGQVDRAVRFAFSKNNTEITHVDNDVSGTRFGVHAEGRLFPGVKIGAYIELETRDNSRSRTNDNNDGSVGFQTRLSEIYAETSYGTLFMGHGSTATDGAADADFSNTSHIFDSDGCGNDGVTFNSATGGTGVAPSCVALEGGRENRIMYVTPGLYGFSARVSHGEGDMVDAALAYDGTPFGKDVIEVAAYFGFRYLPGAGALISATPPTGRGRANVYLGSIAMHHVPTGLNASFAAGTMVDHGTTPNDKNSTFFYVSAGWKGKVWAAGQTAISVHYGKYDNVVADNHHYVIGAALNQEIDAAATDVYLGVRYQDGKTAGSKLGGVTIVLLGARIKF